MDEDAYKKNNKPEKGGQPGVYRHPLTGNKLHATSFPMADAFIRQGWEWSGELPAGETVKEAGVNDANDVAPNALANVEDLKAQLTAAEKARDDALAQVEENRKAEAERTQADAEATKTRVRKERKLNESANKFDEKEAEADAQLKESNKEKESK